MCLVVMTLLNVEQIYDITGLCSPYHSKCLAFNYVFGFLIKFLTYFFSIKKSRALNDTVSQCCGLSFIIRDHTVLPTSRHK